VERVTAREAGVVDAHPEGERRQHQHTLNPLGYSLRQMLRHKGVGPIREVVTVVLRGPYGEDRLVEAPGLESVPGHGEEPTVAQNYTKDDLT